MFMLEIKICIKNIGVQHSLEKNETATMFFLKKPFLVSILTSNTICKHILIFDQDRDKNEKPEGQDHIKYKKYNGI